MLPQFTERTTRMLNAPTDWNREKHGPCVGLPVTDSEGVMYSYWHVSLRERWLILFGRKIRLCVLGSAHPPVAMDMEEV